MDGVSAKWSMQAEFSRSRFINAWWRSLSVSAVPNNLYNLIQNPKDDSREIACLDCGCYSEHPDPVIV